MSLRFDGLISQSLSTHTKDVLANDDNETLYYYINLNAGWTFLDKYENNGKDFITTKNAIRAYSIGHDLESLNFIRSIFSQIDSLIDIDFLEMNHDNGSDIDIFSVNYSSTLSVNAVGQVINQTTNLGSWSEILWKRTEQDGKLNQNDKNTIIHEVGHALGLSHPYDDPFNQKWNSSDTVMSYVEGPNGWNTWYTDEDIKALQSIWGRENDDGIITFNGSYKNYKFKRNVEDQLIISTEIGDELINDYQTLIFTDKMMDIKKDIKGVFDQIIEVDGITGKIYRLYNAALSRFPDQEGLSYWIDKNITKENSFIQTAESFINSDEFINDYGKNINNIDFITNLYKNILNRTPDEAGLEYWLNNLNNGIEEKVDILIGFSESNENKEIFKNECGF